jgi:hypothetical protein
MAEHVDKSTLTYPPHKTLCITAPPITATSAFHTHTHTHTQIHYLSRACSLEPNAENPCIPCGHTYPFPQTTHTHQILRRRTTQTRNVRLPTMGLYGAVCIEAA